MSELYPTPTRRELLDAIADNQVQVTAAKLVTRMDTGRRVTAAVNEMVQAGWATKPAADVGPVRLAAVGRAIRAVRLLDYGSHIVAETGPDDAPTRLGSAYKGAHRWDVSVGGVSVMCGSHDIAADELRRRVVHALAAKDPDPDQ